MRLNKNLTEKGNIVAQFKEDLQALEVSVALPAEDEKFTLTELQAIPDVVDDGSDRDIIPNTKVKISVKDTVDEQVTHTSTLNYKRLNLNIIKEKKGDVKAPGKNYHFQVLNYDPDTLVGLGQDAFRGGFGNPLRELLDLPVLDENRQYTIATVEDSIHTSLADGVEEFTVTVPPESLTMVGSSNFIVRTRSGMVGVVKAGENTLYFDFSKGTTLKDQVSDLESKASSLTSNKVYLPAEATTIPSNFFTDLPESVKTDVTFKVASAPSGLTTISDNAFKDTKVAFDEGVQEAFFSKLTRIGENALNKTTMTSSLSSPLVLGTESLTIGENALNPESDLSYAKVSSLNAVEKVVEQAKSIRGLQYTPTHEEGSTQVDSGNFDTYAKATFTKNGSSFDLYIKKDMLTSPVLTPTVDSSSTASSYITNITLPNVAEGSITLPDNFARGATINELNLKSLKDQGYQLAEHAFKDATIAKVVIPDEESLSVFSGGTGLTGATVAKVEVPSDEVKEKAKAKLTTVAGDPTYNVKVTDESPDPGTGSKVPEEITSSGMNYA